MKKKLFTSVAIMALALSGVVVAYAAATPQETPQYQNELSMSGNDSLSLDKINEDNLPDGVFYQSEISLIGENAQSLPLGD